MLELNENITQLKPSATLSINQKVNKLRQQGEKVYHFGFGQSPFKIHRSVTEELKKHVAKNKYLPSTGLHELKKEISLFLANHQGIYFEQDAIFIGPGSKELLYQIIYLLEGIFLIPQGSWVSYLPQIKSRRASYRILKTNFSNNYKVSALELENVCKNIKGQKTLILNSPNNPTGAVYQENELNEIAAVCKKYNIIVLSDEIYSQINFLKKYSPSMAKYYPKRTIVFGGLSKVFSAGGYRLGYVAIPKSMSEIYNPLQAFFSETFSAVASPIQYAAIKAYKVEPELLEYIEKCTYILKEVGNYVYHSLEKQGIKCTKPEGAFYMIIDFENFRDQLKVLHIRNAVELCDYLILNYNLALLPGQDFYFEPSSLTCRLAYVDFDGNNVYKMIKNEGSIDGSFISEYMPNIKEGVKIIELFLSKL